MELGLQTYHEPGEARTSLWLQRYRGDCGFPAIVLGKREADTRNMFALPKHLAFANFLATDSFKEATKNGWTNSVSSCGCVCNLRCFTLFPEIETTPI